MALQMVSIVEVAMGQNFNESSAIFANCKAEYGRYKNSK